MAVPEAEALAIVRRDADRLCAETTAALGDALAMAR